MADLQYEDFNATTAPAGVSDTTATGGTIDDSSTSSCTLTTTGTNGSLARRRMPIVNMSADNDTLTVKVVSASQFCSYIVLRQDTGSSALQACFIVAGANWTAQRYRDSTGYGSLTGTTTPRAVASFPWLRFRRVSATQIACEAAPDASGVPGTWVSIATADASADSLTVNFANSQLEFMSVNRGDGFNGSLTIDQVGAVPLAPPPVVTSISPTHGPVGTEVTITGTNLTGALGVTHGPSVAMTGVVVDSPTQVRATIASGSPASGTIRVSTLSGIGASATSFVIDPILTSLSIANPNTTYTIGVLLAPIVVTALDQFSATYAGTLGNCTVSSLSLPIDVVGTRSVAFISGVATFSNLTPSTVVAPSLPSITSFTPTNGVIGTVVTITGTNLAGTTSVVLGALACAFTVVNDTTITATIPVGAT